MPSDPAIIVDAHQDIAYNAVTFGRDFTRSVRLTRRLEAGSSAVQENGVAISALPEAVLGRVAIIFGTLFVQPCRVPFSSGKCYETPKDAYIQALEQIDVYDRLADHNERIKLVRTQAELADVLATWAEGLPLTDHQLGIVISMEGADPILEPKAFEEWYERGVRAVGLSWIARSRYAGGNREPDRLSPLGHELLSVMDSFNAILDLSHASQQSFLEALEQYSGPVIASHSNPRQFCNTERHLTDEMIRQLAERDGVIGTVPYNSFLQNDWSKSDPKQNTRLSRYIAVIDHICQVTGSARHVGVGSDFDGGFGVNSIPAELDTVTDLYLIGPALAERGYSPEDVQAILGGNFLRILRSSLPA